MLADGFLVKFAIVSMFISTGWSRSKVKDEEEGEADIEPLIIDRGPYFDKTASRNVTALVGKTTYLTCRIRNLGNRTIGKIPGNEKI